MRLAKLKVKVGEDYSNMYFLPTDIKQIQQDGDTVSIRTSGTVQMHYLDMQIGDAIKEINDALAQDMAF